MTYLITGGAGFIGTNYCLYFLEKENHKDDVLVVIDKMSYASNQVIKSMSDGKKIIFIQEDLTKYNKVNQIFKKFHFDYVINFAAESHVDRSISKPELFIKNNIDLTLNLLKLSLKYKVKRFHQVSTDEVYGATSLSSSYRFKESDNLLPTNPYSVSKASCDLLVLSFYKTYGLNVTLSRSSNNFGLYQYHEKLIPLGIKKAMNNEYIPVYGDGKNIRDWIDVKDHVYAIDEIVLKGKEGEIYNVSSHNEYSNLEIVKFILSILNKDENLIKFVKDRKGHDARYALDTSKLNNELKISFSKSDFFEKLKEYVLKVVN